MMMENLFFEIVETDKVVEIQGGELKSKKSTYLIQKISSR
jgi:hypothetical protein